MKKKYVILAIVASVILGFIVGSLISTPSTKVDTQVTTQTYYDTIPYYAPVPKDSLIVRYETHRLPIDTASHVNNDFLIETTTDSIDVVVPITQKEYQDSTYHAWISGYAVNLDSIETYSRHDITTINQTATAKSKRWGVGITAGYGLTPNGAQPYIGIGISYSIISF